MAEAEATAADADGPALALSHEPSEFSALARSGGDLSTRASALLSRMSWPGKAAEGRRTAAGRSAHASRAAALSTGQTLSHQSLHRMPRRRRPRTGEARTQSDRLAVCALAPPIVPIRILLQGKEGTVGLMPPLGADAQRRADCRRADLHSASVGQRRGSG